MKARIPALVAGLICLPAIYELAREGRFAIAVVLVFLIGMTGGFIAVLANAPPARRGVLTIFSMFAIGVLLTQSVAYTWYYITVGHDDPKLSVGQAVMALELVGILLVGGVGICAAALFTTRITRRST